MVTPTFWNILAVLISSTCLGVTAYLSVRRAPFERNNMQSSTIASLSKTVAELTATVEQLRKAQNDPQDYVIEVRFKSTVPPTLKNAKLTEASEEKEERK